MLAVGTVIARDAGVTIGEGYQLKRPVQQRRPQRGSGLGGLLLLVLLAHICDDAGWQGYAALAAAVCSLGRTRRRRRFRQLRRRRIWRLRRRHERRRRSREKFLITGLKIPCPLWKRGKRGIKKNLKD